MFAVTWLFDVDLCLLVILLPKVIYNKQSRCFLREVLYFTNVISEGNACVSPSPMYRFHFSMILTSCLGEVEKRLCNVGCNEMLRDKVSNAVCVCVELLCDGILLLVSIIHIE